MRSGSARGRRIPASFLSRPWTPGQAPPEQLFSTFLWTPLYRRLPPAPRGLCNRHITRFLTSVPILGVIGHRVTGAEAIRTAFSCSLLYAGRPDWEFPPPVKVLISPLPFDENLLPAPDGMHAVGFACPTAREVWLTADSITYADEHREGYHTPLHEFAHVLDFGEFSRAQTADGIPRALGGHRRAAWIRALDRVQQAARRGSAAVRRYAAVHPGETFACVVESFFERPAALRGEFPEVYALVSEFLRQDPASWDEAGHPSLTAPLPIPDDLTPGGPRR